MTIGLLISFFTNNINILFLLFGFIQIIYFTLMLYFIFSAVIENDWKGSLGILMAFFALWLMSFSNGLERELFAPILYPDSHFGALLMGLTFIWLFIRMIQLKSRTIAVVLFILTVISTVSDVILQYYFTTPAILSLILFWRFGYVENRQCIKLLAFLLLISLTSYLLYKYLPLYYPRAHIRLNFTLSNLKAFGKLLKGFMTTFPVEGIIWMAFLLWSPFFLYYKHLNINKKINWMDAIIAFELVTIIWGCLASIGMDPILEAVKKDGYLGLRHMQPLLLGPVFIGFPILAYQNIYPHFKALGHPLPFYGYIAGLLFLSLSAWIIKQPKINMAPLINYSQPFKACYAQHILDSKLHAGISTYALANRFIAVEMNIPIAPVFGTNMKPHDWLNTRAVYKKRKFDFIINDFTQGPSNTFDFKMITKRFGKPSEIFKCGNYEFYVYHNSLLNNIFKNYHDPL